MFAPAVALSLLVAPATPDSWQGHEAECRRLEDAVVPAHKVRARETVRDALLSLDFTIYSSAQSHYVVDIVGYFAPPQATELDCLETAQTAQTRAISAARMATGEDRKLWATSLSYQRDKVFIMAANRWLLLN